uniref:Extracellular solute-binding protein n=1 Tax=candidate division CPR3 bacterium TaxID=2268181 RepID=A0A7C4R5F7_UNCC3
MIADFFADKKRIFIIGGLIVFFLLIVFGIISVLNREQNTVKVKPKCDPNVDPTCEIGIDPGNINTKDEITINIWGVFDDSVTLQPLIDSFNRDYPNIKIVFSKKDYSDYERNLIDEIAAGEGPDIFAVNNYWIPKHRSKMSPAANSMLSIEEYNQTFIPSVYEDFVIDGKIYGIPLYTDNMALIYNRDILGKSNIYEVPKYWEDVLSTSKIITKKQIGNPNEIEIAGIGIGTADNVSRSSDILLAMMMQTGTPIISNDKRSYNFNQFRKNSEGLPEYPGTNALSFYTSFANPNTGSYSWNEKQMGTIEAFANGKVGMILGYNYFLPLIEKINPSLKYGVSELPQIKGAPENISITNYWGWSVNRNTKYSNEAWAFLLSLSKKENIQNYLSSTGRVSPRKDIKGTTINIQVFENQKSYAKTIFKPDAEKIDQIFDEMINDVVKYKQSPQNSIDTATRKANELLSKFY